MTVEVVHFSAQVLSLGSFVQDISGSCDAASRAGDLPAKKRLTDLWLVHMHNHLKAMTPAAFVTYFSSRQVWRSHGDWTVIKTVELPCVAYTAQVNLDGSITVIALGAAWRYPYDDENKWWTDVILPRVRSL